MFWISYPFVFAPKSANLRIAACRVAEATWLHAEFRFDLEVIIHGRIEPVTLDWDTPVIISIHLRSSYAIKDM